MSNMNIDINPKDIDETLNGLHNICNCTLVLYDAHAKGNLYLTNLANMTYYLLWNFSKSMIELKIFLSATIRNEQDFAKGQLCITINECIKHVIGFKTNNRKNRENSLWIREMGTYISKRPELSEQYEVIRDDLLLFAESFEKDNVLKDIRNIAAHGDIKIESLIKIHNLSFSKVMRFLDGWRKCMLPAANFAFTCFERECQLEMNNNPH